MTNSARQPSAAKLAPKRELFAWAMYDFANSGYTTVVLTAVFNTYFVTVIAGETSAQRNGQGTLLWSIAVALANGLVLLSAPTLGALGDRFAIKKRLLAISTLSCIGFTALLASVGPGEVGAGMALVVLATMAFATGENLIAAFLPEIAPPSAMGRISGYGWSLGYLGGMSVLGLCLAYVSRAQAAGDPASTYVPVTMLITAAIYALAALPTFLWLRERATPAPDAERIAQGLRQGVRQATIETLETLRAVRGFRDLYLFLLSLTVYSCGIYTVIVLAAVYAQEVMGFDTTDTITMIMIVNLTAAVGAFGFGRIQDRLGSVHTLGITLLLWALATLIAYFAQTREAFWLAANLVGIALGSSQSAGRALVGQFTPPGQSGKFFGLWGVAVRFSAIIGPLCYGMLTYFTGGDHRTAILSTLGFFLLGLAILFGVDEQRGRAAAHRLPARP